MYEIAEPDIFAEMTDSQNYKVIRFMDVLYVIPSSQIPMLNLSSDTTFRQYSALAVDENGNVTKNRYGPVTS